MIELLFFLFKLWLILSGICLAIGAVLFVLTLPVTIYEMLPKDPKWNRSLPP